MPNIHIYHWYYDVWRNFCFTKYDHFLFSMVQMYPYSRRNCCVIDK
ncbi:unnamed protein product [Brugia pahangi]|uniref:Uncharacterized protein n=1 Tax=Brugia pahangi TaxID=6280 RepID=A0A0N4TGI4_BRUPA|nr:unnamed protein product [Brugia pahangi]